MKRAAGSLKYRERNYRIRNSFEVLKKKFSEKDRIVLELEIKNYGANVRIYVIDKLQKTVDKTVNDVIKYLEEKNEMSLYYTIQGIRVDKKSQIFKQDKCLD